VNHTNQQIAPLRAMTASSGMATSAAGTSAAVTAIVRIRMSNHPERPLVPVPGPFVALVAFVTVTTLGGVSLGCFAAVCAPGR
jgi:hypothetical protein